MFCSQGDEDVTHYQKLVVIIIMIMIIIGQNLKVVPKIQRAAYHHSNHQLLTADTIFIKGGTKCSGRKTVRQNQPFKNE